MNSKRARVVIVGGGFGGLFTALDLGNDCDVTLISDADQFLFTPMLYEYLSGEVEEWHIASTYSELLDDNVKVIRDDVTSVDFETQKLTLRNQSEEVAYDVVVLAVGGVSNFSGVFGAASFHSLRKIAHADELRQKWLTRSTVWRPTSRAGTPASVDLRGGSEPEPAAGLATKMADCLRDASSAGIFTATARAGIEMGDRVRTRNGRYSRVVAMPCANHMWKYTTLTRVVTSDRETLVFEHNGKHTELIPPPWSGRGGVPC